MTAGSLFTSAGKNTWKMRSPCAAQTALGLGVVYMHVLWCRCSNGYTDTHCLDRRNVELRPSICNVQNQWKKTWGVGREEVALDLYSSISLSLSSYFSRKEVNRLVFAAYIRQWQTHAGISVAGSWSCISLINTDIKNWRELLMLRKHYI